MLSLLDNLWNKRAEPHPSTIPGNIRLKEQRESVFRRFWRLRIEPKTRRKAYFKSRRTSGGKPDTRKLGQRDNHHDRCPKRRTQEKRECAICASDLSTHHFPKRPPTAECEHHVDVCKRCLRMWIDVQYHNQMWNDIKCPTCASLLTLPDMREFAPTDILKRYLELSTRAALEAHPNFLWCGLHPCKSGQVHLPDNPRFVCNSCQRAHCIIHNVKWHKNETCEEYDRREDVLRKAKEEEASRQILQRTTKLCPGCERSIEKIAGCDQMYCIKCRCHFCWRCLAPYPSRIPATPPTRNCECI